MPLVSVLIPCYKAERFIDAALACVRAQAHADWELIIVEDGSNDGTEQKLAAFASTVKQSVSYHNLGSNQGVAAARNTLMSLAQGELFAFLDADDTWTAHHLSDLVDCLAEGHALAFTGLEIWDAEQDRSLGVYLPGKEKLQAPRRALFNESLIMSSTSVALPSATFRRIGNFDTSLRIGEDRDYWFRCLADGGSLGCTGKVSCRYLKHAGSSMAGTLRVVEDNIQFFRKHQLASDIPPDIRKTSLIAALLIKGRIHFKGAPDVARACYREAIKTSPFTPQPYFLLAAASIFNLRARFQS